VPGARGRRWSRAGRSPRPSYSLFVSVLSLAPGALVTDSTSAPLSQALHAALSDARKNRDRTKTQLLSMTLSEVRNREIELGRPATDSDVEEVLTRARKRRAEAAEQMRAGGRPELAEREEEEARILQTFLPEPLTEDEVRGFVREILASGITDPGPLMGQLMPKIRGRFDGREANRIVREERASG
jgi:uncharacterized protein